MASSPAEQATSYPLTAYNFRVTVGGTVMRFTKVSGLVREYQTQTYRHGRSFLEGEQIVKYFVDRYVTVTLEQGTVHRDAALHTWLESGQTTMVEIQLCDAAGVPVMVWRIAKAVPVKLSAPTFDASSNNVSIESLELRAAGITAVPLS